MFYNKCMLLYDFVRMTQVIYILAILITLLIQTFQEACSEIRTSQNLEEDVGLNLSHLQVSSQTALPTLSEGNLTNGILSTAVRTH